jgi:hypothetical protein
MRVGLENTDSQEDQVIEALEEMIASPLDHPLQEIIDRVPEIFEIIGRLDDELYDAIETIAEKTEMIGNLRDEINELKVDRDN